MFRHSLHQMTSGLLALTLAAYGLVGCGGPDAATPAAPPTAPAQTAAPPTAAAQTTPAAGQTWTRTNFNSKWDIEYPADWTVLEAPEEGNIFFQGEYKKQLFGVSFTYPPIDFSTLPGVTTDTLTLDAWVNSEISKIAAAPGAKPVITDLTVAGTPAKKVLLGGYGWVYIARQGDKNPRLITAGLPGSAFTTTPPEVEELLDRLIAGVR